MTQLTPVETLAGKLVVPVWPDTGKVLGLSKDSAYGAVSRGEIPSIRIGRRLLVPVPALLRLLGADVPTATAQSGGDDAHSGGDE